MLAYPVSKKPIDYSKPVFIQPKLDGVRCLIQGEKCYNGNYDVVAYSRTGKKWKNIDHILRELKSFFQKHPNVVLDGELYNHELKRDFEKIISLVRKQKPTENDRLEADKLVQFHVYDYFDGVIYDSYKTRMYQLGVSNIYDKQIKYVQAYKVNNYDESKIYHKDFLNQGYEGSDYFGRAIDFHVGYEGGSDKTAFYVHGGPTVLAADGVDGTVTEISGKAGVNYNATDKVAFYGEFSGITAGDFDNVYNVKAGAKYSF